MAHIRKREGRTKPWEVKWRTQAGEYRSRSFRTRRDANHFASEVESLAVRGHDWQPVEPGRPAPTVGEAVSAYVAESSLTQARSTARQKAMTLGMFLEFVGPNSPLSVLSKRTVLDWYQHLDDGRTMGTRKKMVQRVQHMWKWAFAEDEFGEHVPRPTAIPMPSEPRTPTVAPTWAEMDACIAATLDEFSGYSSGYRKPNRGLYQLTVILRFTGLRVQQAMELRWDDFDLRKKTLTIRGELGKTKQERSGRRIPVSVHLVEEMKGWGRREGYVIESNRKTRKARQRDTRRAWQRAGVRPEACEQSHHAFRKGFVTGLLAAGAPELAVRALVGHSRGVTGGIYADVEQLGLREVVALIPPIGKVVSLPNAIISESSRGPQGGQAHTHGGESK